MTTQSRDFIDLDQIPAGDLRDILALAVDLKTRHARGERPALLAGKVLAMVFAQPSTRTRISFDVGMRQLGGETLVLAGNEMQLARDETIADTARVMSRFVDAIMIRTLAHGDVVELAAAASVPVINGLTRRSHPCQVMADILTYQEKRAPIDTATVAWVGDANNVLASWVQAARVFGFRLRIACPPAYGPSAELAAEIGRAGPAVELGEDPQAAVRDADLVVTDTWVSIGDDDVDERRQRLRPYRVDAALMAKAAGEALFMHCLPAHRGDEVTDEVIDGPQSVVFDEAENRLHAQKAILCWVFGIDKLP